MLLDLVEKILIATAELSVEQRYVKGVSRAVETVQQTGEHVPVGPEGAEVEAPVLARCRDAEGEEGAQTVGPDSCKENLQESNQGMQYRAGRAT